MKEDKMRITVLGAGRWGYNLIRNFSALSDIENVLVYDTDPSRFGRIKFGPLVNFTTSIDEAYGSSDTIVIATPISTHFDLAMRAIRENKHVFIEKPATANAEECAALIEAKKEFADDKVAMIGHIFLYNSAVLQIKDMIDRGEIGDVRHIHTTRLNFGPIRTDVDAVVDIATHDISIINFLLASRPTLVSATSNGWVSGKMDTCISSLTYDENILATIYSSWLVPEKEQKMVIVGSKKMIVFNNLDVFEPIKIYNKSVIPSYPDDNVYIPKLKEEEIIIPKVLSEEPLKTECQWFIDCVNGKKKPKSDLNESLSVMIVLDAIRKSYTEKIMVRL